MVTSVSASFASCAHSGRDEPACEPADIDPFQLGSSFFDAELAERAETGCLGVLGGVNPCVTDGSVYREPAAGAFQ